MLPHAPRRPHKCQLNDSGLELLTILVSLKLWQARLRGCTFEILTDNQVSVYALNNQRSSDHFMQCSLWEIWLLLALNNIHLIARHILSFSRHLCGLRGACGNIPGSPPSIPWWFDIRFHCVSAIPAPLSFHIRYLLLNLEQATHLFSAFHSVFRSFICRSHRCLTVFAAVPGISSPTLFMILLSAPWELICTGICCSVSISSLILFRYLKPSIYFIYFFFLSRSLSRIVQ